MNFAERIQAINRERIARTPMYSADGKTCVFCGCVGSLVRESDFCYHDRTRIDVAVGVIRVQAGSLYCDFCQQEQPDTEVHTHTLCDGESLRRAKSQPAVEQLLTR